ncbi:MAG: hypothetical protein HFACDABA_01822 [Anaerolineales bacterium]|nr:hypothetical protein [Anaerolineales bacterium]
MSQDISLLNPATLLPPNPESPAVPWSSRDTWIGFGLFMLGMIVTGAIPLFFKETDWLLSLYILAYQPIQAIPIFAILLRRRAAWGDLGFRPAQPNVLALGCGFILVAFLVNFVNNAIMFTLGVEVQAQQFTSILTELEHPGFLLFTGIFLAPLIEETVMRGFLFGGLRHRLGWLKAALISSALFGALHLSIAAFIPTFTLGFLFCYLYQRSNSVWPGVILHTLINALGLCAAFLLSQYADPSAFFRGI